MIRLHNPNDDAISGWGNVLSYSSPFYVRSDEDIPTYVVGFEGNNFVISKPLRLGSKTWRSIPLLTSKSAKFFFGDLLDGVPLQVAAYQQLEADTPTLLPVAGRGDDYDPSDPPDSVIITAQQSDQKFSIDRFLLYFWSAFLASLRVRTGQWWIGRTSEGMTGNLHFCFQSGPEKGEGRILAPICRQVAADRSIQPIDAGTWKDSLQDALNGRTLNWIHVIRIDIEYYFNIGEHLTSILLFCGWVENLRDSTLFYYGKRISDLNTSPTDLLKHITLELDRIAGRNAQREIPEAFDFIRASWISRGNFSHGKTLKWKFSEFSNMAEFPSNRFYEILRAIENWFNDLQSPA